MGSTSVLMSSLGTFAPLIRSLGILDRFFGGVRANGEFLNCIRNALSYTILVPPGVVEYSVPPGVDE